MKPESVTGMALDGIAQGPEVRPVVETDHTCVGCGYNLRGLSVQGVCPECGKRVADSLNGHLLVCSAPSWLARLKFGSGLLICGLIATGISRLFVHYPLAYTPTRVPQALFSDLGAFFSVAIPGLNCWGAFLLVSPELGRVAENQVPRNVIRVFAGLVLAFAVIQLGDRFGFVSFASFGIYLFFLFATIISDLAMLLYLARLSERIPNRPLASSTRKLMLYSIVMHLMPILLLFLLAALRGISSRGFGFGGVMFTPAFVILGATNLIGYIWKFILLVRYRRLFHEAALAASARESHS